MSANCRLLKHYFHHFLVALTGLALAYVIYGSVTVWEIALFFLVSFLPMLDELLYSALYYLSSSRCRLAVNHFLSGNLALSLYYLHDFRASFSRLVLHNIPVYLSLWFLWYFLLIHNIALGFYALSALQTHLLFDILNDQVEFAILKKWLWPFRILFY